MYIHILSDLNKVKEVKSGFGGFPKEADGKPFMFMWPGELDLQVAVPTCTNCSEAEYSASLFRFLGRHNSGLAALLEGRRCVLRSTFAPFSRPIVRPLVSLQDLW